jgi:GNAT superfamily N-acetyltransferase
MTSDHAIATVEADLDTEEHQQAVRALTADYALDPMGNGAPLADVVLDRLIAGLRDLGTAVIMLAYVDGQAAAIATCFLGFSTFQGRRLLNIHDFAVRPAYRGRGVGRVLMEAVKQKASDLGCCKLTLEVQAHNESARRLYERSGFTHALADTPGGGALFFAHVLRPQR